MRRIAWVLVGSLGFVAFAVAIVLIYLLRTPIEITPVVS